MYSGSICDVPGVLVGHAQDDSAMTGVTAVLLEHGATAAVDVRGGGPGTRETDALAPGRLVQKVDAVLLCGGSAFGLAAADGAMEYLEKHGRGYQTAHGRVPIVAAAVLYDLGCGRADIRPDAKMGMRALECAGKSFAQGRAGAGRGATVGKILPHVTPAPGGIGSASIRLPDGVVLGALAAVNAAGDVYDPETGALLAAGLDEHGNKISAMNALTSGAKAGDSPVNTTLGVIATNAELSRDELSRLALLAHDGFARTIRPVHLPVDGDTAFALSTGGAKGDYMLLCALAAEVMARAIANAVLMGAEGTP